MKIKDFSQNLQFVEVGEEKDLMGVMNTPTPSTERKEESAFSTTRQTVDTLDTNLTIGTRMRSVMTKSEEEVHL